MEMVFFQVWAGLILMTITHFGCSAVVGTDLKASVYASNSISMSNSAAYANGMTGYSVKVGPTSGHFYILGEADDGTNRTIIARIKANYALQWVKVDVLTPSHYSLVVGSTETNVYFLTTDSPSKVLRFKGADGSFNNEYNTNFVELGVGSTRLASIPTIDGFSMSISTLSDGALFCRGDITNPGTCMNLTESFIQNLYAVPIDINNYVMAYVDTNGEKVVISKANVGTNTIQWSKSVAGDTTSGVSFGASAIYDSSSDLIYNMINYNSNIMLYSIQVSTGAIQPNQWKENSGNGLFTFNLILKNSICKFFLIDIYRLDQIFCNRSEMIGVIRPFSSL